MGNKNDIILIKDNKFSFILVVIIMNFIYIFIVNIQAFTFSLFSIDNKVSYYLDLNRIFTGEYNKFLYISLTPNEESANQLEKGKNNQSRYFIL